MAVTIADVKLLGTELAALSDALLTACITDAETELSEDILQGRYDLAVKYLAAHEAKLRSAGGSSGTVTQVTVGGVSRSYANGSQDGSDLDRTSYGQRLARVLEGTAAARVAVSE